MNNLKSWILDSVTEAPPTTTSEVTDTQIADRALQGNRTNEQQQNVMINGVD